jgi:predicted AAA+ superfamily ATPase
VEVAKVTLHELLEYLSDAFFVFGIQVFRQSLRARQVNPRKVYAIVPGLAFTTSHVSATDLGSRLETAVYPDLRRRLGRARGGASVGDAAGVRRLLRPGDAGARAAGTSRGDK